MEKENLGPLDGRGHMTSFQAKSLSVPHSLVPSGVATSSPVTGAGLCGPTEKSGMSLSSALNLCLHRGSKHGVLTGVMSEKAKC